MQQNQVPALPKKGLPVIVLTGGGSGGHITPLLSLAHALKEASPGCRLVYIGNKGDQFDSLQQRYRDFDDIGFINGGKFRRYNGESFLSHLLDIKTLLLNIRDFFRVIASIFKALKILRKLKPDVVFSKGSFVAVPVGIAAKLLRIPIVTHDSDSTAGLANRIVGRWAVIHATGMPAEFYNYNKSSVRFVGIPIDPRIKQVSKQDQDKFKGDIGLSATDLVLLVTGGGLGSQDLNEKVTKASPELLSTFPNLHIVHIAGQKNVGEVEKQYLSILDNEHIRHIKVLDFTPELYKYSGAADLIITRAGATALAEYAAQAKACILVPSPFLTGGHQLKNAELLKKLNAVEVVENDANPEKLFRMSSILLKDSKERNRLAQELAKTAKTDASEELAGILLDVADK
jgi:UDP-N-acetylglucosamine--N-acetylmuramyl-(pentapeptide) pyrophosphoryl-undecaprenol N-acetylglucosamine transferase